MTKNNIEIFINGAGLAGLLASIAFARKGFSVVCIDKMDVKNHIDNNKKSYRTTAFLEPSKKFFDEIGIWTEIEKYSCPMNSLKLVDTKLLNNHLAIEATKTFSNEGSDTLGWNIKNNDMIKTLFEIAKKEKNISLFPNTTIEAFEITDEFVEISLSNKKHFSAKLIVGSDGKDSFIRNELNIKSTTKELRQNALTFGIQHEKSHNNISNEIYYSGGPFTTVPIKNNSSENYSSVVWMDEEIATENLMKLDKTSFEQEINKRSADILGHLKLVSEPQLWKMRTQVAKRLISFRAVIIAEAAHVLPPIGAQGFNMSINDIKCLLKKSINNKYKLGEPRMLLSYERERLVDMNFRVSSVSLLNYFSKTDNPFLRIIRSSSIKYLFNFNPLKSTIMKLGLGSQ